MRAWLEGAKKRESALAIVTETEALTNRSQLLRTEAEQLLQLATEGLKGIPKWADEAIKGPHWETERQGLAKQRESRRIELDIEHRLQSALSHKSDLEEGHEALGQRYLTATKKRKLSEMSRRLITMRFGFVITPLFSQRTTPLPTCLSLFERDWCGESH